MGFIAVMTWTDITGHEAKIGGFFDRFQDAAIADQRLLWLFPADLSADPRPGC